MSYGYFPHLNRLIYGLFAFFLLFGFSNTIQARSADVRVPSRGMTRVEVRDLYGRDPDHIEASEEGETWVYVFGKGKLFIPYYGPFAHLQTVVILFNSRGRVRDYHFSNDRAW